MLCGYTLVTLLVRDMGDIEEAGSDLIGDKDKVEEACPVTQEPGQGQEGLPQPPGMNTNTSKRRNFKKNCPDRFIMFSLIDLVL